MIRPLALTIALSVGAAGCATTNQRVLDSDQSQLEVRSAQTRVFDTTDRERTLRTVIATLQDLGFVIDKADATVGTVSATKLDNYALRMTVGVYPRGESQLGVRANAQFGTLPVTDPEPYQKFFASLGKSMFLEAQTVDGGGGAGGGGAQAMSSEAEPEKADREPSGFASETSQPAPTASRKPSKTELWGICESRPWAEGCDEIGWTGTPP